MARVSIETGASCGDTSADTVREAFVKTNQNFVEIYADFPQKNAEATISADWAFHGVLSFNSAGHVAAGFDVGNPGFESNSIQLNGVSYDAAMKINEFGGGNDAALILHRHANGSQTAANMVLSRARGASVSHTDVQDGDLIGRMLFAGWYGSSYWQLGRIDATVKGAPASADMPGVMTIGLSPDGSASPQEVVSISAGGMNVTGSLTLNGAPIGGGGSTLLDSRNTGPFTPSTSTDAYTVALGVISAPTTGDVIELAALCQKITPSGSNSNQNFRITLQGQKILSTGPKSLGILSNARTQTRFIVEIYLDDAPKTNGHIMDHGATTNSLAVGIGPQTDEITWNAPFQGASISIDMAQPVTVEAQFFHTGPAFINSSCQWDWTGFVVLHR